MTIVLIIIGIIGIIALAGICQYLMLPKCPHCKKRDAEKISSVEKSRQYYTKRKEEEMRHYELTHPGTRLASRKGYPKIITVRYVDVPMIRIFYEVTYRCKVCGTVFSRQEKQEEQWY
jgi:phage FluMu protein Com